ncbi:MAG: response regulator [bacterium]
MKTILLIDDDKDIHVQARAVIEKAGYRLISAFGGDDGIKKAGKRTPELVILDYFMPDKNGLHVYLELRQETQLQDVPVVMFTSADHSDLEVKKLLESGLNAYLRKPFGPTELLSVIQNVLVTNEINLKNKELRKTLETSRNFLENLIESCPVVILTSDHHGIIKYVNKTVESILDYEADELVGSRLSDFVGEDVFSIFQPGDQQKTVVYDIACKGGKFVPVGFTYSHLRDYHGELQGLLAVGQDLSAQKQLEKELLEKERLAAITESIATINHKINNPLTPILGNIQLIRQDEAQFQESHKEKLEIIETNARKICEVIKSFNQLTNPISTKYYRDSNLIEFS